MATLTISESLNDLTAFFEGYSVVGDQIDAADSALGDQLGIAFDFFRNSVVFAGPDPVDVLTGTTLITRTYPAGDYQLEPWLPWEHFDGGVLRITGTGFNSVTGNPTVRDPNDTTFTITGIALDLFRPAGDDTNPLSTLVINGTLAVVNDTLTTGTLSSIVFETDNGVGSTLTGPITYGAASLSGPAVTWQINYQTDPVGNPSLVTTVRMTSSFSYNFTTEAYTAAITGLSFDDTQGNQFDVTGLLALTPANLEPIQTLNDLLALVSAGPSDTLSTSATEILPLNFENLVLTGSANINGTGNALNNVITGNGGANVLAGLGGSDALAGGLGNDTYFVGDGDTVTEATGAGSDRAEFGGSGGYTLAANVEYLHLVAAAGNVGGIGSADNNVLEGNDGDNVLDGGAGNDILNGYRGNDWLTGGLGNDLLAGGRGADVMQGGAGDDLYFVDNYYDTVIEAAASGNDTVVALLRTYTLPDNVENLVLDGTIASTGIGNALANMITGNAAANTLTGGAGNDVFVFNTAPGPFNVDIITDFAAGDAIALSLGVFNGIGAAGAAMTAGAFVLGSAAGDGNDRIIYDQSLGHLYYDADGNGVAATPVLFAELVPGTALTAAAVQVVA